MKETNWTRRLVGVPSWALEDELQRRGDAVERDITVRLPGLVVDPLSSSVVWRGEEYALGGRRMELLYALALLRQQGRRRVRLNVLLMRVWGGGVSAYCVRTYIHYLRSQFPGLIDRVKAGSESAYGLVLDEAHEIPSAMAS